MIVEIATLGATLLVAVFTFYLAWQANRLTARAVKVEADKLTLDWGRRVTECLSACVALRMLNPDALDQNAFRIERRALRARLFALLEEGRLFIGHASDEEDRHDSLLALAEAAEFMDGRSFLLPEDGDYEDTRRPQIRLLRTALRRFTSGLQRSVGDEWVMND